MDGDNAIQALAQAVNDKAGVKAVGSVSVVVSSLNGAYSTAVTFPAGRFTAAPYAQVSPSSASPHTTHMTVGNVTPTGMIVYAGITSGALVTVFGMWSAHVV